ncbi:hypothetical protein [Pseudochrobactrum saccharolyticum]|uniref:hypothetical protein n=1 Tax=Pseudochrobactrum saccharolyticum TaxID=354352 RepID=UPI00274FD160|nr:hypothetical protein [Pseudochrobactrum saccharolyticum]MDP8250503.1 hypothetical protein [Pseudochrobactrum saccharolyticum]
MTYPHTNGMVTDKSYAYVPSYTSTLDPTRQQQIVTCYVNTNRPNANVTIKNDSARSTGTPKPLALFDKNHTPLPFDTNSGTFSMTTESSGRAVFLVGSNSGDFYITQLTLTADDGSEFSAPFVFGDLDPNLAGNLPALTIAGLSQNNNLQVPTSDVPQLFNVTIASTNLPAAFIPSSRIAVILNNILVYCGNLSALTADGINIACSLLKTTAGATNTIGYFIAKPDGQFWSAALLSPLKNFTASGTAIYIPSVNNRTLVAPQPVLISSGSVTPADMANNGLKLAIPASPAISAGDLADVYVSINGTDDQTSQPLKDVSVFSKINPLSDIFIVPQTRLSGYQTNSFFMFEYQLFDSIGQSKGWSNSAIAQSYKQFPAILLETIKNNANADGVEQNRASAAYYADNGIPAANVPITFTLGATGNAVFDGNQKSKTLITDNFGKTSPVLFTDSHSGGETVELTTSATAAQTIKNFTFTQATATQLGIIPIKNNMPADGTSTCSAKASISGSGNVSNISVNFTTSSNSTFFIASNGVTVSADSKTATAQTGIDGLTAEVFFTDNSNTTIDITITASANGLTNATQPFHFTQTATPLTLTLAVASDDNSAATGNGQDKHSAIAVLSPAKAQAATFTLPSNQQATFSETDTSIYTLSPDKKTVSVISDVQSGQTPIVHFTDANTAGEFVVLTASTSGAQDNQHNFGFGPVGQTAIVLDKYLDNSVANGHAINAVEAHITVNGYPPLFRTPITYHVTGSAYWQTNNQHTLNDTIHNNDGYSINGFYDTNTAGETVSVTATCNGVTSDPLEFTFAPYNQHTQTTVTLSKAMDEQPADGRSLNRADATVNINGASAPNGTQVTFFASGHARFAFSDASIYTTSTSGGSAAAPFYDTNPNGETVTITAKSGGSTSNPLTFTFEPSIVPLAPIVILNPYEGEDIIIPINIGQHGPVYASGTATAGQVLNFLLNWQPFGSSTVNSAGNWTSPPIHDSGNLTLSVSYASEGQNAPRWTVHFSVEYSDT